MRTFLDINCPDCGSFASFEFAHQALILKNSDKTYFEDSKNFKVFEGRDHMSYLYRYALYYPRVSNALGNISDLPDGYSETSWRPVRFHGTGKNHARFTSVNDEGVLFCKTCPTARRHVLNWPKEAYFQITYRGQKLWAYNREFALRLLKYLESNERMKTMVSTNGERATNPFLNSVPTLFQTAKARPIVVRDLKRILGHPTA